LLDDAGFVVDIANNGQEAVEMVGKKAYDIVLMDMQMPVMDGVTATIEIRKDARFTALPIVAMTANAMQQDKDKCEAAGMNGHVAKPIDPDEMFRALLKWIKPRHAKTAMRTDAKAASKKPESGKANAGLPEIPGLDIELGLRRVIGKVPLYLSMLRKYITNQEFTVSQIRKALDEGDRGSAERHAHSAKGVSGNIGAVALQEMAGELEKMIKEGAAREAIEAILEPFAAGLTAMIANIKAALPPEEGGAGSAGAVDMLKVGEVINKLASLLAGDDSEASDVMEENLDLLRSAFGPDAFAKIDHAIKQFDFEKGLELVKARAGELNITLS
jgi:two-component system sensor histidine kinase/response regulator